MSPTNIRGDSCRKNCREDVNEELFSDEKFSVAINGFENVKIH